MTLPAMKNLLPVLLLVILGSCSTIKRPNAYTRYPAQKLYADFDLFRAIMEDSHPGLYWYTSRDSMDHYFQQSRSMIRDSMTLPEFRLVMNYVISRIGCGHTTSRLPARFSSERDSSPVFPLQIKTWADTTVITQNISRRDSIVRRGYLLNSIDGRSMAEIRDTLFRFLSTDGYNLTHKYQTVSNRNVFGSLYTSVFGNKKEYRIGYTDTLGQRHETILHAYIPPPDTGKRQPAQPSVSRRERKKRELENMRSFTIDTALNTGVMDLNSFTKNAKLRSFFKSSFKTMRKNGVTHLVIDMRSNGGGTVTYSNLLTRYLIDHPFKIADSLYAIKRYSRYRDYQQASFLNTLFLIFMTRKGEDGNYHFRYFEKKRFDPKKKNHFNGEVYLLSGGNTFSAATLVMHSLKGQENVTIVGEETGGGQYGNNAWLIPDVTLPNTNMRFRLPLFRLVIDKNAAKGYGVQPEVEVLPTADAIRRSRDFKMDVVREIIRQQLRTVR